VVVLGIKLLPVLALNLPFPGSPGQSDRAVHTASSSSQSP